MLYWEDIEEGQALPSITYELNLLRLVAFVRATGLYDNIHYDRDYAQAVGMRDAFMSTPHMAGLFSRLLTDWSGPEATIKSLSVNMKTQCCTNDILQITGKVGKKYQSDNGEYLVDVADMNIGHALTPQAVGATATMAFPSKTGGPVKILDGVAQPPANQSEAETPEFAKALMGIVKPSRLRFQAPLTEHEIHLWCECLEDWNPLYWNKDYASKSGYGGLIAPPAMGWFFGSGTSVNAGLGYLKPGVKIPDPIQQGLTGMPLLQALRVNLVADNTPFDLPDFPEAVVIGARDDFYKPVRPGDFVHNTYELLSCSPLKRTKVGEGHFLTFVTATYNQHDELVKTMTLTLFNYRT